MKKWIHSSINSEILDLDLSSIVIKNIVFVSDAEDYNPGQEFIEASSKNPRISYDSLSREELLALPKREFESIHDVSILRKLNYSDLTPQQQRDVALANKGNFHTKKADVESLLKKIQSKHKIYMFPTQKNDDFVEEIQSKGGDVSDKDVVNIVSQLTVEDYCHSTLSYLRWDWNALLLVFEFNGSYTFDSVEKDKPGVTVTNLDIYIKIDVDNEDKKGYAALSFHNPEFKLIHPFKK